MVLKEYEIDGRTYLFDSDNVPEGAKLVTRGEKAEPVSPKNKRAYAPKNKEG